MALLEVLGKWAKRKSATPAQNIAAVRLELSRAELDELNANLSGVKIYGQRLPKEVLAFSWVEAPKR